MNSNSIVRAAFDQAAHGSADYLAKCFRTRSTDRVGSWYEGFTPDTLRDALLAAEWEPYPHPAIKAPAVGYRATIGGKLGMVALDALPADAVVSLIDPKDTGKVSASVSASAYGLEAPDADHTTMILGPSSEVGAALTIWTFHPGAPVAPSMVDRLAEDGTDRHGLTVTVAEAIALGFGLAKLTE